MIGRHGSVQWIAGTAIACVMALVAAWVLLLGPMLDGAAATRQQAADVRAGNEALQASVDALRADFARLPEYEAELAALRQQLPSDARLADLTREIAAAAAAAGVAVVGLDVAVAVQTAGDGATASADPSAAVADAAPADPAASSTAPVAPATTPAAGTVAIPVTVRAVGPVEPVRAFLRTLQTGLHRQLLVATLSVRALEESAGDESRPASRLGDVEATVGAFAYVLPSDDAAGDGATSADGPLPVPSGANPFAPSAEAPAAAAPDPAQSMADAVTSAIEEAAAQGQAQAQAQAAADAETAAAARAAADAQAAAADAQAAAADARAAVDAQSSWITGPSSGQGS